MTPPEPVGRDKPEVCSDCLRPAKEKRTISPCVVCGEPVCLSCATDGYCECCWNGDKEGLVML